MTIKDITPRGSGFPPVGTIRLGVMVGEGDRQHPQDVDYFVIEGEYLKNAPDLVSAYGSQPKELKIWLVHPTASEAFRTSYRLYGNSGLQCEGDGETIQFLVDPNGIRTVIRDGVVVQEFHERSLSGTEIPMMPGDTLRCPGKEAPEHPLYERCKKCGMKGIHGVLTFVVRDPNNPTQPIDGRMVTYRLQTGSWRSTMNLMSQLQAAEEMANFAGKSLFMLPMILRRVPGKVSVPSTDKKSGKETRVQVEKYFLQVEIEPDAVQKMVNGPAKAAALLPPGMLTSPGVIAQLSSGIVPVVDPETGEIVDEVPFDGLVDESGNPPPAGIDPRFADIHAMRDEMPENWKDFHARLMAVWGDENYPPGQVNKAAAELLGLGRAPSDPTPAFWNAAIDVVIAHLKGG